MSRKSRKVAPVLGASGSNHDKALSAAEAFVKAFEKDPLGVRTSRLARTVGVHRRSIKKYLQEARKRQLLRVSVYLSTPKQIGKDRNWLTHCVATKEFGEFGEVRLQHVRDRSNTKAKSFTAPVQEYYGAAESSKTDESSRSVDRSPLVSALADDPGLRGFAGGVGSQMLKDAAREAGAILRRSGYR